MEWKDVPPQVAALLQELDADPDAAIGRLAAIPRQPKARKLRSSEERLAEELATAYRDVTCELLARYAQTAQFADPYWAGLLHRSVRKGEELRLTPFERIRSRAAAARRGLEQLGAAAPQERAHLEDLARPQPSAGALEAALASWRLRENDHAAITAAWEYIRRGEYASAARLLDFVVETPAANLNRSYAWEVRGALAIRQGRAREAARAYREASDTESDRPAPLCSWLVLALSTRTPGEAAEAARRIDEMIDESDPSVGSCIEAFDTLRSRSIFEGRASEDMDLDGLCRGPATSTILNALL